jgi:hypothetical protein
MLCITIEPPSSLALSMMMSPNPITALRDAGRDSNVLHLCSEECFFVAGRLSRYRSEVWKSVTCVADHDSPDVV